MNNKGVTLIELLIVIVVIGIIATFAVPAVGDIITNSEKDAVLQDARSLADQARLYCGQGMCSAAQEGTTGLTWADMEGFGGLDVFDATAYEETDGDATGAIVIIKKNATSGVWEVQLTDDATNGDYSFGGVEGTPAFVDPVNASRTDVY